MFYFVEEISLMEHCDWSVGQCLQTLNEASTILLSKVYLQCGSAYFQKKKKFKFLFSPLGKLAGRAIYF